MHTAGLPRTDRILIMDKFLECITDVVNSQRLIHRARGHHPVKGDVFRRPGWWCDCGVGWRKW